MIIAQYFGITPFDAGQEDSGVTNFCQVSNNAASTLLEAHAQGGTTLTLPPGQAAQFGTPTPTRPVRITVMAVEALDTNGQIVDESLLAIYKCTGITGDVLTIGDAQGGTTDQDFGAGSIVATHVYAQAMEDVHVAVNAAETSIATLQSGLTTLDGVAVKTIGSYDNPDWLVSLPTVKITGTLEGAPSDLNTILTFKAKTGVNDDIYSLIGLTGPIIQAQGTIASNAPAYQSSATWNSVGTTFKHILVNVTNTASAAGSKLIDLQVGGSSMLALSPLGTLTTVKLGVNEPSPGAQAQITTAGASTRGLIVKGVSGQSANLIEAQDSTGAVAASVSATGLVAGGTSQFSRYYLTATGKTYLLYDGNGNGGLLLRDDTAGVVRLAISPTGLIGVNEQSPGAQLQVTSSAAATKGLIVKAGTTARTISNVALTSNVVTITTTTAHGFTVGQTGVNTGLTNPLNDVYQIASVPTTTTFTYTKTASNITSVADSGTATGQQTANLLEAQDSSGTVLTSIRADGRVDIGPTSILANGRVGIGTSQPDRLLHVNGTGHQYIHFSSTSSTDSDIAMQFSDTTYTIYEGLLGNAAGAAVGGTPGTWGVFVNNAVRLAISQTGNVGIGTFVPGAQLQVNTSAATTKGLIVKAAPSQTANLLELQNSSGTVLTSIAPSGKLACVGRSGPITANADAATVTFDLNVSDRHTLTLGGGRTLALSNDAIGQQFTILLKQDATGSRTVTWWSGIKWSGGAAPTLTATANKEDIFTFLKVGSGDYRGFVAGQNH